MSGDSARVALGHLAPQGHFVRDRYWTSVNPDGATEVCLLPGRHHLTHLCLEGQPPVPLDVPSSRLDGTYHPVLFPAE